MKIFLRSLCIFAIALVRVAHGAGQVRDVNFAVNNAIKVRVSGNTEELNSAAIRAFRSHGAYDVVADRFTFDLRFSAAGANQVRVDVLKDNKPVASQVLPGANLRAALFRAADFAVEHTNNQNLKGFFSARLAFVSEATGAKEVYISDLFFSPGEVKRITNDRKPVLTPRWSPDGTRLIYTSYYKNGFPDIFEHDLRTFARTSFVSLRGSNLSARYSPTGRQVAMVLSGEGQSEIYVSNAQGRDISRKTRSDQVKASPCWSPDGGRIVFAAGDSLPQLFVMSAAGGGTTRLATGFTYAAEPDWNRADPSKLACTVKVPGGSYQIAVYDFGTGSAKVVSKADFDAIEPCWLADGRHLVYTARSRTSNVLCILDTESGKSTTISNGMGGAAFQANVWNP